MALQKQHILFWLQIAILPTFFVAKMIYTLFCQQIQLPQAFCCKNDLSTLVLLQKWFTHTFFVTKTIYALFLSQKEFTHTFLSRKQFTRFFCRKNSLRTSSGKFLRVESCHPESSDFLVLCINISTKLKIQNVDQI